MVYCVVSTVMQTLQSPIEILGGQETGPSFFVGREGILLPAHYESLAADPELSGTGKLLAFFRAFWLLNGTELGPVPRDDRIELSARSYQPPLQLRSRYQGMTAAELEERQAALQTFKEAAERDRAASCDLNAKDTLIKRDGVLKQLLQKAPDCNGTMGVETYTFTLPSKQFAAYPLDRLNNATVLVAKSHRLENEQLLYHIPSRLIRDGSYPWHSPGIPDTYAFVDRQRVDPVPPFKTPIEAGEVIRTMVELMSTDQF